MDFIPQAWPVHSSVSNLNIPCLPSCRWASSQAPYHPFMAGYFIRLLLALGATRLADAFPPGANSFQESGSWFAALMALGLATSFTSTLMFTALGSFFNKISDPGKVAGGRTQRKAYSRLLDCRIFSVLIAALLRLPHFNVLFVCLVPV